MDSKSPAAVATAAPVKPAAAKTKTVASTATGSAWWDTLVETAKSKLQALLAGGSDVAKEVVAKIEPIVVEDVFEGVSKLEQMALDTLLGHSEISKMEPGPEKTSAAIIQVASDFQHQFGGLVASEVQQAVANVTDALGIAKTHLEGSGKK